MRGYVESLWEGISKRLDFCDKGGTTTWSEAPAEGIFSILSYIIENKPGLSVEHMFQLCRIVKEGPAPATKAAVNISKKAFHRKYFCSNFISLATISKIEKQKRLKFGKTKLTF